MNASIPPTATESLSSADADSVVRELQNFVDALCTDFELGFDRAALTPEDIELDLSYGRDD
jgi:hypothetical protein